MKTIALPDELNLDSSLSIKVYDYKSTEEISKQQILLSQNTFSFLQEGNKEVFFDNSSYSIDNGQFLLMKSGNCLMTEKLSPSAASYRSILLFFSTEDILKFVRKFDLKPGKAPLYYSTYSFNFDAFISRYVESLLDLSKQSHALQKRILPAKLEEIILYLIDSNGTNFLFALISDLSESQKFIQTIESNRLNKLSLEELSFLSNMSVSTFKREFQKHFDSSPAKWFQEQRLEHSAYLLKDKSKRASDIFEEVGYESLSNFIQAFKSKYGITPKQYQSN